MVYIIHVYTVQMPFVGSILAQALPMMVFYIVKVGIASGSAILVVPLSYVCHSTVQQQIYCLLYFQLHSAAIL